MLKSLMQGSTVYVLPYVAAGTWGDAEEVAGVLVKRETVDDLDTDRLDGVRVSWSLAFPRDYSGDLRGALVRVGDEIGRVVGTPAHVASPLDNWDMLVELEEYDG